MSEENKPNIAIDFGKPMALGLKETLIGNLLSIIPSIPAGMSIGITISIPPLLLLVLWSIYPIPSPSLTSCILPSLFANFLIFSAIIASTPVMAPSLAILYFAPKLLQCNYYIKRILKQRGIVPSEKSSYVFQISTLPRQLSGLRGVLEDADDIGILTLGKTNFTFNGANIQTTIPYTSIASAEKESGGSRVLFLMSRIKITLLDNENSGIKEILFCERDSSSTPESWKTTELVFSSLRPNNKKI